MKNYLIYVFNHYLVRLGKQDCEKGISARYQYKSYLGGYRRQYYCEQVGSSMDYEL